MPLNTHTNTCVCTYAPKHSHAHTKEQMLTHTPTIVPKIASTSRQWRVTGSILPTRLILATAKTRDVVSLSKALDTHSRLFLRASVCKALSFVPQLYLFVSIGKTKMDWKLGVFAFFKIWSHCHSVYTVNNILQCKQNIRLNPRGSACFQCSLVAECCQ